MTRIKSFLTQTSFVGNAALLASSTVLGQGLVVLVQPLLTRVYKPEDFGWWALYGSILSLAAVVINLRYEQAIQLPKEEREARGLLLIAVGVGLGLSLLIGGFFWFFRDVLSVWLGVPIPGWFAALVGVGLACIALMQSGSMWALRLQRFGVLAQTKFQQGLWQALTQVALGLLVKGPAGLLLGDVFGRLGGGSGFVAFVAPEPRGHHLAHLATDGPPLPEFPGFWYQRGFANGGQLSPTIYFVDRFFRHCCDGSV
ncbi:lipopolysaccharide biosynthesis protein [Meiothermus taiwanensis]|uniref:lipopolysaccharide biosynthesis protein n=1 Tax=Meiothermus taiwanensis TaxID=172827 RepID=UPI000B27A5E4|nr:oligosaccharide flippase family protein [Meiothermus taiwanensis]